MSEPVRIIFLDVDGVLNCETFYQERHDKRMLTFQYWWWKLTSRVKWVFNGFRYKPTSLVYSKEKQARIDKQYEDFNFRLNRFKEETCIKRLRWLDETCRDTGAWVVISSVWRSFFTIEEWNRVFFGLGLKNTKVVGVTGHKEGIRGGCWKVSVIIFFRQTITLGSRQQLCIG
jgi:hypothetical protein